MKKLRVLLCVIVVLVLLVHFGGSWLLERSTRSALPLVSESLAAHDIIVGELDFGRARITSLRSVAWEDVKARVRLPRDSAAQGQSAAVHLGSVELAFPRFSLRRAVLDLRNLSAQLDSDPAGTFDWASPHFLEAARHGRVIVIHLRIDLEIDRRDPRGALRSAMLELARVFREGKTELPITVDAGVMTRFDGGEVWAGLEAVEQGGITAIEVDRADLRRLSSHFSRPLTESEIELVAENPLCASTLLMIKKYAEQAAQDASSEDPTVPEDAYRHVLWSFLLTRRFGSEFAETVTDAHETGITDNTEAEHRMDYSNNAVGRRYAALELSEEQILARMRTDPTVITTPR